MIYSNPLHPPVDPANYSRYSSLEGALDLPPSQPTSTFLSPTRRRLPQPSYIPVSKWKAAMGRLNQLHNPITFDYIGYSKQGVPMQELMARGTTALASMIQGANDAVFAHTGLIRIAFRIIWPGYEHVEWARTIELTRGKTPITRAQLGSTISLSFARFVEKTRLEPSTPNEWNLTSSGIRFEHLVLVALVNVFDNVWLADVAVDLR
ncbi:hypothetical protein E4T56_gene4013 [Termitomyces sp. T112]|nr:hypothetical protein E4T56_gene4013 [Termitomyces sp. T112]KAH0588160.1 hypothetical protein H2248_006879 [Termitomyces sp. 'cryptogamus']KNZ77064.1 hypothetical protein J132_07458 [Termitomyces sp. J132]